MVHMSRGGMLPPNQGMTTQQGSSNQNNAPTPGQYPQPGQTPSRTGTPGQGQGVMMNPSPSLAARQPPGASGSMNDLNNLILGIPQGALLQIKTETGIPDKDIGALTHLDKVPWLRISIF